VLIYMTAKVSGGKLNPAVSLGLFVAGSLPLRKCLLEMGSQVLGAVLGAAISRLLILGTTYKTEVFDSTSGCMSGYPDTSLVSAGCFTGGHNSVPGQIFLWEFITTFVLVSVVFATAVDDAAASTFVSIAPFIIGLSLFACAQASGPYTGGCLNPARFIGPWIVFSDVCHSGALVFPYVIGEMLGGALAGLLFKLRLRLQMLYQETMDELREKQAVAEGHAAAEGASLLSDTEAA